MRGKDVESADYNLQETTRWTRNDDGSSVAGDCGQYIGQGKERKTTMVCDSAASGSEPRKIGRGSHENLQNEIKMFRNY